MGSREMQDDPTDGAHDLDPDRDQRLPQPRDLRAAERGAVGAELQLLAEDKGRRRQRDPQLIGPEARATGAPEGQRQFQFFASILTVAARAVDVGVDPLGRLSQIRDDKARVISGLASVVPHHFGFDDRPARRRPRARLIGPYCLIARPTVCGGLRSGW
jgi:hypothetical protein